MPRIPASYRAVHDEPRLQPLHQHVNAQVAISQLSQSESPLQKLFDRIIPAPPEWFKGMAAAVVTSKFDLLPCESYGELVTVWQKVLKWTPRLEIALSTVFAAAATTQLQDDQVWIRLIGLPGTAKTIMCEALSQNEEYCFTTSVLTGLHSGYTGAGAGADASLIPKINGKLFIINEGDTILKAPNRPQILSELRDLYSGFSRSTYRNGKIASYTGIRNSMILAGTPAIRELNASALGDRFIDCIIYERESDAKERFLVREVLGLSLNNLRMESNGKPESQFPPERVLAYRKSSGFVKYLRENIIDKLAILDVPKKVEEDCETLGLLISYMRTRPIGEEPAEKELHIRLSKQLLKLAMCTAAVMGVPLDGEVMRRVASIAWDTCYGYTFDICKVLHEQSGLDAQEITNRLDDNHTLGKVQRGLGVLLQLKCVRSELISGLGSGRRVVYSVNQQMKNLLDRIHSILENKVDYS